MYCCLLVWLWSIWAAVAAGAGGEDQLSAGALLGLANKGSLTAGRDADITIVDRLQRSAFATIIGGQVCYMDGKVLGRGGRIITTAAGADYVLSQGLEPLVVDLADSSLLQKTQKR